MNKFYLNFEFYLHVEKSSEVQLRKEKIKASLNFFISFLPRDFETFDVNSISMKTVRQKRLFRLAETHMMSRLMTPLCVPGYLCLFVIIRAWCCHECPVSGVTRIGSDTSHITDRDTDLGDISINTDRSRSGRGLTQPSAGTVRDTPV